jgi:hypothetical protein
MKYKNFHEKKMFMNSNETILEKENREAPRLVNTQVINCREQLLPTRKLRPFFSLRIPAF